MESRAVVCAIVVDAGQRVLLVKNPHWGNQLTLPAKQVDPDAGNMAAAAVAAVREDLGLPLPNATASPLGFLGTAGLSGRTGETTLYEYWAFHVEPGEAIKLPAGRMKFLASDQVAAAADVTWSAKDVVSAVFDSQEVAVAVVNRPGRTQTEYLALWNDNYGGYFFPAGRVTSDSTPATVARALVRAELGYNGPVLATEKTEVPDFHFSPKWGHARAYKFHIVAIELPPRGDEVMDLHRPLGPMDLRLKAAEARRTSPDQKTTPGWSWRWFTSAELLAPPAGVPFTATMKAVVPAVLATVPPAVRPLRRSEGSVAFIRGTDKFGRDGWLAQWNDDWKAFFLIAGHREPDEDFARCVAREVEEELEIASGEPPGFTVAKALPPLRYVAWSPRASAYTDYELHPFEVTLTPERKAAVDAAEGKLKVRWLTPAEVWAKQTTDGRRVSETAEVMLTLSGQI